MSMNRAVITYGMSLFMRNQGHQNFAKELSHHIANIPELADI